MARDDARLLSMRVFICLRQRAARATISYAAERDARPRCDCYAVRSAGCHVIRLMMRAQMFNNIIAIRQYETLRRTIHAA